MLVSEIASRHQPQQEARRLAHLTLIVRPPGRPGEIGAFTDAERAEADLYAAETAAAVDCLG